MKLIKVMKTTLWKQILNIVHSKNEVFLSFYKDYDVKWKIFDQIHVIPD